MPYPAIPARLKKGFIFIPNCECADECNCTPHGYICSFQGGFGIIYKLDALNGNGAEPISIANYLAY